MFEKEIASSMEDDSTQESESAIGDDTFNEQNESNVKEGQQPLSDDDEAPSQEVDDDPSKPEGGQGF